MGRAANAHSFGQIDNLEEVSKFYAYMAGDDARCFTGAILVIDSSYTASLRRRLMRTMLAARYLGSKRVEAVQVPVPQIADEEALVKVSACVFCGSDISIVAGTHPRAKEPLTIGHEFCGTITDICSAQTDLAVGDLVTCYPLISCGRCFVCRTGNSHVCRSLRLFGLDVDGGMAEFVKLPVSSLVKLPQGMLPLLGAIVEPLAVAVHGVSRAPIKGTNTAVVMGAGTIGILPALVARSHGISQVMICDILPSRLALAAELGLHTVAAGKDLKQLTDAVTDGDGVDIVFECAGAPDSARDMTTLVRCRGTIVNLGVFKTPVAIDMQAVNFKELSIVGSRVYTREDFRQAAAISDKIPLHRIVTHSFALSDVRAAFECFLRGEAVCKVIIHPDGPVVEPM